jgi:hypothetical protein
MKRTTDFSTLMTSRRGYQNHPKSIAEHPQACPAVCRLSPVATQTVTANPVIRAFQSLILKIWMGYGSKASLFWGGTAKEKKYCPNSSILKKIKNKTQPKIAL